MIAPDSRSGGMGDVGAATAPDANAMHWNPAKYAFIDNQAGVSLAFTPWLKQLIDDINLAYLAGYYKLDDRQTLARSEEHTSELQSLKRISYAVFCFKKKHLPTTLT